MSNPSPRFTGLFIPAEVLNHPELTLLEQMLLSWIDALYSEAKKGCYASNEYFSIKLKVKENTIAKALTSLRQKKLIEDVSFDGRHRIIRARIGAYVEKCQSNPALDLNPIPIGFKSNSALDENPKPTYIGDQRLDNSIDTPPIPPQNPDVIADAIAAKAAEEILKDSSKEKLKRIRTPSEFNSQIRELGEKLINILIRNKANYVPPRNLCPFLTHVDYLLRRDKRDPQLVLDVFSWAVADSFWADKMYNPNPAEYLRKKFDQLEKRMDAKPPVKSNEIDRRLRHKDGSLFDRSKEFEF